MLESSRMEARGLPVSQPITEREQSKDVRRFDVSILSFYSSFDRSLLSLIHLSFPLSLSFFGFFREHKCFSYSDLLLRSRSRCPFCSNSFLCRASIG